MRYTKNLAVVLAFIFIGAGAVNASTVTYRIIGTMEFDDPSPSNPKANSFHGSTMTWDLTFDQAALPSTTSQATNYWYGYYDYDDVVVGSDVKFTDRPNGLADLNTTTYDAQNQVDDYLVYNAAELDVGESDRISGSNNYIRTDALGIFMPKFSIFFARDFFDGDGPATFPAFSNDDIQAFSISRSPSADYTLVNPSISTVPLPAAAWLFGSALLGLAAVKRRKT